MVGKYNLGASRSMLSIFLEQPRMSHRLIHSFHSIPFHSIFVTVVSQERLKGSWSLDAER